MGAPSGTVGHDASLGPGVRYRRAGCGVSLGTEPESRNCRQPRYPGRSPRGPEVLRPRLSTGVPLSAIGLAPSMRTSVVRSALRQSLHRETRGRMISKQCCSAGAIMEICLTPTSEIMSPFADARL